MSPQWRWVITAFAASNCQVLKLMPSTGPQNCRVHLLLVLGLHGDKACHVLRLLLLAFPTSPAVPKQQEGLGGIADTLYFDKLNL